MLSKEAPVCGGVSRRHAVRAVRGVRRWDGDNLGTEPHANDVMHHER
jgi:hypothetical protein